MNARTVVGAACGVLLVGVCAWAAGPATSLAPAVVVPAETFQVSHPGDGVLRWSLLDGTQPGGPVPVSSGVVLTERGGTLDVQLADGLLAGPVAAGTLLAVAHRPDQEAMAEARSAESAAADADALALASGGRPGIVAAALARVEVARAALTRAEAAELRAEAAAAQGAIPAFDAELAHLEVKVRRSALHAARVEVQSAQMLPWEAEQAAADARAAAALSWAQVADARAHGPALAAPFDGVLRMPGGEVLLQVESLDTRWLQVRVPERTRAAWTEGAPVEFRTTDGTASTTGRVVRVDTAAAPSESLPVVWATVHLDNPAPSGATGIATTARAGGFW